MVTQCWCFALYTMHPIFFLSSWSHSVSILLFDTTYLIFFFGYTVSIIPCIQYFLSSQSHSVSVLLSDLYFCFTLLLFCYCCIMVVEGGIFLYLVLFGVSSMSPVCARQKKSVRQLTATLHLYTYTYILVSIFFLFSSFSCFAMPAPETILPYIHHRRMACVHRSFNFTPLILIPVSSHLIHSKSLHVILDVVVYAIC